MGGGANRYRSEINSKVALSWPVSVFDRPVPDPAIATTKLSPAERCSPVIVPAIPFASAAKKTHVQPIAELGEVLSFVLRECDSRRYLQLRDVSLLSDFFQFLQIDSGHLCAPDLLRDRRIL